MSGKYQAIKDSFNAISRVCSVCEKAGVKPAAFFEVIKELILNCDSEKKQE